MSAERTGWLRRRSRSRQSGRRDGGSVSERSGRRAAPASGPHRRGRSLWRCWPFDVLPRRPARLLRPQRLPRRDQLLGARRRVALRLPEADSTYGFTYPPFAALLMLPMAITPWTVAIVISCITCVRGDRRADLLAGRPGGPPGGLGRWFALALAVCFAIAVRAAARDVPVRPGQHDLVLVVAADLLLLVSRGQPVRRASASAWPPRSS